jgi:hypothetical protein
MGNESSMIVDYHPSRHLILTLTRSQKKALLEARTNDFYDNVFGGVSYNLDNKILLANTMDVSGLFLKKNARDLKIIGKILGAIAIPEPGKTEPWLIGLSAAGAMFYYHGWPYAVMYDKNGAAEELFIKTNGK